MLLPSRATFTAINCAALLLSGIGFAAAATAQSVDWPVQRLHTPSSALTRLPQADQAIAIRILRPELGPLFQGDATSVLDQQIRSFRAERINPDGMRALALSPPGGQLCGSNGNCSFWIIDLLHHRTVLRTESVQAFAVESAKPHAIPDIITSTRSSAAQSEMTRWRFVGSYYERDSCATLSNADDSGAPLTPPRITPHSCTPEGN